MSNIYDLIGKNIREIPYEGLEIDKDGIINLIENLLKAFISFSHTFTKTNKGYLKNNKYYSRDEIVREFIQNIK